MSATEIARQYQAGTIETHEALAQTGAKDMNALYEMVARESRDTKRDKAA